MNNTKDLPWDVLLSHNMSILLKHIIQAYFWFFKWSLKTIFFVLFIDCKVLKRYQNKFALRNTKLFVKVKTKLNHLNQLGQKYQRRNSEETISFRISSKHR